MNSKALVSVLAAVGCGIAITIASCNSDNSDLANATNGPSHNNEKYPQALAGPCNTTIAVNRCPVGAATLAFDVESSILTVSGLQGVADGVSSTFGATHNWEQSIDANIPQQQGQQMSALAYNGGQQESQLDMIRDPLNPSQLQLNPTFLAGDGNYSVEVYDNGQRVAVDPNVVKGGGPTVAAMGKFWHWVKFHIHIGPTSATQQKGNHIEGNADAGACMWVLTNDLGPGCSVTLPDNQNVQGNEIRFIEIVDGSGRYPYHTFDRIDVLSNTNTYKILAEYVGG